MNYDYTKSNLGSHNVTPLAYLLRNKKKPLELSRFDYSSSTIFELS